MFKVINPENQKELSILWRHYPPVTPEAVKAAVDIKKDFVITRQVGASQCLIFEGKPGVKREDCLLLGLGKTECSIDDQFSRKVGRKLSMQRALNSTELSKAVKKSIWMAYLTKFEKQL